MFYIRLIACLILALCTERVAVSAMSESLIEQAQLIVTTADGGIVADSQCALAEAVTNANLATQHHTDCAAGSSNRNLITFAPAITQINLTETLLLESTIALEGNGVILSGNDTVRVIAVGYMGNVQIDGLVITGGKSAAATATESAESGGGILNHGTLALDNVWLHANRTGNGAVGQMAGHGGGIYNASTLIVTNSTINNNATGSGIDGAGSGDGGGIYNAHNALLSLTNVTMSGNHTGDSVENSTVGSGGGLYNEGTAAIRHATFKDNQVGNADGEMTNHGSGGAIRTYGTLHLHHTIITDSPTGGNCLGDLASSSFNLFYDAGETCGITGTQNGNLINTNTNLDDLRDNGGTTPTHLPLDGSAAIDAGDPLYDALPHSDQRGLLRVANGRIDIGAVETDAAIPTAIQLIQNDVADHHRVWLYATVLLALTLFARTYLKPNEPSSCEELGS